MVRKRGLPQRGELVICRINKVSPNSASAILIEYNLEGMIHISEIFSGWVRDIRNHVRADQQVVGRVLRVDEETSFISLSLKRVDKKQEKEKAGLEILRVMLMQEERVEKPEQKTEYKCFNLFHIFKIIYKKKEYHKEFYIF